MIPSSDILLGLVIRSPRTLLPVHRMLHFRKAQERTELSNLILHMGLIASERHRRADLGMFLISEHRYHLSHHQTRCVNPSIPSQKVQRGLPAAEYILYPDTQWPYS